MLDIKRCLVYMNYIFHDFCTLLCILIVCDKDVYMWFV